MDFCNNIKGKFVNFRSSSLEVYIKNSHTFRASISIYHNEILWTITCCTWVSPTSIYPHPFPLGGNKAVQQIPSTAWHLLADIHTTDPEMPTTKNPWIFHLNISPHDIQNQSLNGRTSSYCHWFLIYYHLKAQAEILQTGLHRPNFVLFIYFPTQLELIQSIWSPFHRLLIAS